jgi:biotin transport system ATP-binding protein
MRRVPPPSPPQPLARGLPLLEFLSLSHRFRSGFLALDRVSLRVDSGDFLVLAGRNGSGKSVLLRHAVGLLDPSSGEVLYRGQSVASRKAFARRGIGLVFQDAEAQTVGDSVLGDAAFGPENLGYPPDEVSSRAIAALASMGLEAKAESSPASLSGGERRRLAIAGMLAMDCEALLLDEPFSNLDYPSVSALLRCLVDLSSKGITIVVATHEIEKVLAHANRLAVLSDGRLELDAGEDELERGELLGQRGPLAELGIRPALGSYASRRDLTWIG